MLYGILTEKWVILSFAERGKAISFGVWRSLVARGVWDAEVGGSNPLTPTRMKRAGGLKSTGSLALIRHCYLNGIAAIRKTIDRDLHFELPVTGARQ